MWEVLHWVAGLLAFGVIVLRAVAHCMYTKRRKEIENDTASDSGGDDNEP